MARSPLVRWTFVSSFLAILVAACVFSRADADPPPRRFEVEKSPDEWKKLLSPAAFHVLREKGTERAFTGAYWNHHEAGVYRCAACGRELFRSDHKFDSGTGWPSYFQPIDEKAIAPATDTTFGMQRTEVMCGRCGSHLGHVFDDGPKPTGLRYCINSVSLVFSKDSSEVAGPPPSSKK